MDTMEVNGETLSVRELSFESQAEHWNEYVLEDGTTVKTRMVAVKMFRVLDDNGEPAYTRTGDPYIVVHSARHVTATEKSE